VPALADDLAGLISTFHETITPVEIWPSL
jgi:hypothetical protein